LKNKRRRALLERKPKQVLTLVIDKVRNEIGHTTEAANPSNTKEQEFQQESVDIIAKYFSASESKNIEDIFDHLLKMEGINMNKEEIVESLKSRFNYITTFIDDEKEVEQQFFLVFKNPVQVNTQIPPAQINSTFVPAPPLISTNLQSNYSD
jgi:hypothetical protein